MSMTDDTSTGTCLMNSNCPQCGTAGINDVARTGPRGQQAFICPECGTEFEVTRRLAGLNL